MPTSDTLVSPQHILPPPDFQFCDSPEESISFPSVLSFTSLWKDPGRDRAPGCCQGKPTALSERWPALPGTQPLVFCWNTATVLI